MLEGVPKRLVVVVMQVTFANTTFTDYQNEHCPKFAPPFSAGLKEP